MSRQPKKSSLLLSSHFRKNNGNICHSRSFRQCDLQSMYVQESSIKRSKIWIHCTQPRFIHLHLCTINSRKLEEIISFDLRLSIDSNNVHTNRIKPVAYHSTDEASTSFDLAPENAHIPASPVTTKYLASTFRKLASLILKTTAKKEEDFHSSIWYCFVQSYVLALMQISVDKP